MSPAGKASFDERGKAGQLLFVGIEGTQLSSDLAKRLQRIAPGGIILFARNLVDAAQVAACKTPDDPGLLPLPRDLGQPLQTPSAPTAVTVESGKTP